MKYRKETAERGEMGFQIPSIVLFVLNPPKARLLDRLVLADLSGRGDWI
jgi:hypothetical protein